jgi:type IV pilus assembly protein PilE
MQNTPRPTDPSRNRPLTEQLGFTLIEVVVVMVVLGILAAIAIPSYTAYVQRGYRSSAQAFLTNAESRMMQYYLDRRSYTTAICKTAGETNCVDVEKPDEIRTDASATLKPSHRYDIAITIDGPPAGFRITATPVGNQSTDRCGILAVNQAGVRGVPGSGSAVEVVAAPAGCW